VLFVHHFSKTKAFRIFPNRTVNREIGGVAGGGGSTADTETKVGTLCSFGGNFKYGKKNDTQQLC
jgi:hypothetical protein